MKYMQQGGFQSNPLMRLTLGLTVALLVGFWITNIAMYFNRMSLTPESVVAYYNGSEEDFRPARSTGSMIETTHMHLPVMAVVLLVLTHLLIFIPMRNGAKVGFIVATFLFAALEEGGGWLVRFVNPAFAPLKIVGFLGLQCAIAFLLAVLAIFLWRASRRSDVERTGGTPTSTAGHSSTQP